MTLATENVNYMRQERILDPLVAADTHVTILGCGTVGSNTATQLARAGFKQFYLIDMDVVEVHNMPSQAFSIDALGQNKASALAAELETFTDDLKVSFSEDELVGGEQFPAGVIVCAVDSMEMRKLLFQLSAKNQPHIGLFVDVRMGGNTMISYAFDPNDTKRVGQYEKTLYSDADAEPVECGGRTFAPVGALSGAFVTQYLTKHLREGDNPPFIMQMDFDRFDISVLGLPKLSEE